MMSAAVRFLRMCWALDPGIRIFWNMVWYSTGLIRRLFATVSQTISQQLPICLNFEPQFWSGKLVVLFNVSVTNLFVVTP